MSDFKYLFQDKYQNQFGGITFTAFTDLLKTLNEKYYVSSIQIIESASFSLAMVIRSHLGLSAEGGKIGIIAKDNLAGSLALAAARRLYNAGTNSTIIIPQKELGNLSKDFQLQAEAVSALGLELLVIDPKENEDSLNELFQSSDNVLMGTFDNNAYKDDNLNFLADMLNELSTPIHSIICPHGICQDTGKKLSTPIYSSSTLSLGIPLSGLNEANDFLGRHYICEISVPKEEAKLLANIPETLFAEQPVCQIFKKKD